jgi:hypothetical protein
LIVHTEEDHVAQDENINQIVEVLVVNDLV